MTKLEQARRTLFERLSELALPDEARDMAEAIEKMIEAKQETRGQARSNDDD